MKIILVSSSSGSRGGGELYLLYLGRALAQRGHDITLWASNHPRMDELANSFSAFGSVLRSKYQNTYDQAGRSIAGQLNLVSSARAAIEWKATRADFVHLNKQNLEDGLDLLRAASWCGIPNLCTVHLTQSAQYLRAKLPKPRDWVSRRALKRYPGLLVTVLESRRQDLLDFLGQTPRVRMIPNGVPLYDLRNKEAVRAGKRHELGIKPDEIQFVAVGRMVAQKRPMLFLETAERILRAMPSSRFLWIGDGDLTNEWDQWVAAKGLGEIVRRSPWQPDVQPYLLSADVFLHVAEYEGLPLALLEAMSAELPIFLADNLRREMPFLNDGNSVPVTEATDWSQVLGDREKLGKLAKAGRVLCEQEFSYGKMAESYELLYEFTRKRKQV